MKFDIPFVHLHLHTTYSFLDGAIRIQDAVAKASALGMGAVAITDHGNMFGAVSFYKSAKKAGIKPIIGTEIYVAHGSMKERKAGVYHLVFIAENNTGYKNLMEIVTKGYLEGFYRVPRVDKEVIASHSQGLIALSGCIGGEVPTKFREQGKNEAISAACAYREIFGKDNFFIEVQNTGRKEQVEFNASARQIARQAGVEIVATNDVHYLDEDDYLAHQVLVCIGTNKRLEEKGRLYSEKLDIFFRDGLQMQKAMGSFPDGIENTIKIAARCNVEIELGKVRLPIYKTPDGISLEKFLEKISRNGLEERFREFSTRGLIYDRKEYEKRLEYELSIIKKMGFSGYFLIVWDFISFARKRKIPVGPGRGSGGGSLVAYCLRITDIDPIRYGLLFERFLNPERISMPDFDIDFCKNRRDEVLQYVIDKYGSENVAQIATFHQLKSKLVVRDVGRVLGLNYSDVDKIAKMIPAPFQGRSYTIDEAIEMEPRLKKIYNSDESIKLLLNLSRKLEGLTRHAGTHAAGVVISDRPLPQYTPLYARTTGKGEKVEISTQYDKDVIEDIGLVKFDFLGLKTLTVIETAINIINETSIEEGKGRVFNSTSDIPLNDKKTFELISSGDTTGVFQLESRGFRELLRKLKPNKIEDVIAAVALYRPGPLQSGTADSYIARKNGGEPITYIHPSLEGILRETYGVMIYQEQVMQAARTLAGFSMSEADNLRRAMGKKKKEEMARLRELFVKGAVKNGVGKAIAEKVYEQMKEFASYAFNKSHSAGYAIIAYQTAYLKCHFPVEFLCASMICDENNIEKVASYISEGRDKQIKILPPDINQSGVHFKVVKDQSSKYGKSIRFGLQAVKGIGQAAEAIIAGRKDGEFVDLYDFCARVDLRICNRSKIENLIGSGCFDRIAEKIGLHRGNLFASLDSAIEYGKMKRRDREEGQQDLLGLIGGGAQSRGMDTTGATFVDYSSATPPSFKEKLKQEKNALGCYVSGHPLEKYRDDVLRFATCTCLEALEKPSESTVVLAGMIEKRKERQTKGRSGKICFFNLEDLTGRVEVLVPPRVYSECEDVIERWEEAPVLVSGIIEHREVIDGERGEESEVRIIVQSIEPLETARIEKTSQIHLYLSSDEINIDRLATFKRIISEHKGLCCTFLHVRIPGKYEVVIRLSDELNSNPDEGFFDEVRTLFTNCSIQLR